MTTPQTDADDRQLEPERGDGLSRSLVLFLGFVLLTAAVVLLLFGRQLFGDALTAGDPAPVLDQVPVLNTPAAASPGGGLGGAPQVGEVAPDFTLEDLQGNSVTLSDFRGRPVIVNFWATWCGPCRIEMPALQETFEERQDDGLVILAVNREESPAVVEQFFYDEFDLTFTPLLDQEAVVADQYSVFNMPTTYFVTPSGEISGVHRGPLTPGQLESFVAETINEG